MHGTIHGACEAHQALQEVLEQPAAINAGLLDTKLVHELDADAPPQAVPLQGSQLREAILQKEWSC